MPATNEECEKLFECTSFVSICNGYCVNAIKWVTNKFLKNAIAADGTELFKKIFYMNDINTLLWAQEIYTIFNKDILLEHLCEFGSVEMIEAVGKLKNMKSIFGPEWVISKEGNIKFNFKLACGEKNKLMICKLIRNKIDVVKMVIGEQIIYFRDPIINAFSNEIIAKFLLFPVSHVNVLEWLYENKIIDSTIIFDGITISILAHAQNLAYEVMNYVIKKDIISYDKISSWIVENKGSISWTNSWINAYIDCLNPKDPICHKIMSRINKCAQDASSFDLVRRLCTLGVTNISPDILNSIDSRLCNYEYLLWLLKLPEVDDANYAVAMWLRHKGKKEYRNNICGLDPVLIQLIKYSIKKGTQYFTKVIIELALLNDLQICK